LICHRSIYYHTPRTFRSGLPWERGDSVPTPEEVTAGQ